MRGQEKKINDTYNGRTKINMKRKELGERIIVSERGKTKEEKVQLSGSLCNYKSNSFVSNDVCLFSNASNNNLYKAETTFQ